MNQVHRERCRREITKDVIFLLRWKTSNRCRGWEVDSVWLDRDEADRFRLNHIYRWPISQVYGVPTYGDLSKLLQNQDKAMESSHEKAK